MSATLPIGATVPESVLPADLTRALVRRGTDRCLKVLSRLAHAPAADYIGPKMRARVERLEMIPNAPLRFRYLAMLGTEEEVSFADLCRALHSAGFEGWHKPVKRADKRFRVGELKPETSRIARALGLECSVTTKAGRRYETWRSAVAYDEGVVIGAALGMDPHEFGA